MPTEAETLPEKVQEIRVKFRELLEKTNKDHPRPQDVRVSGSTQQQQGLATLVRCIERRTIC